MREEKDDDGDTNKQEEAQQLSTTVSFSLQQNTWNILREKKKVMLIYGFLTLRFKWGHWPGL